jgi:hypothetical protein
MAEDTPPVFDPFLPPPPPPIDPDRGFDRLLRIRAERRERSAESADDHRAMARLFTKTFGTPSGRRALEHLARLTIGRTVRPGGASDAELWHLEGQRALFRTIETLIEQGKQ